MNYSKAEKRLLRNTRLAVLTVFIIANSLFALFLAPMEAYMAADRTFGFDYLPNIIEWANRIIQLCSFILCYGVTIYSIFRFSLKETVPTIIISCAMTVYKYGMNLVAGWFFYDGVPSNASERGFQIFAVIANAILELLPYLIIILIACSVIKRSLPIYELQKKNYEKSTGEKFEKRDFVFPFKSFHSKKNPIQHSAYLAAVVLIIFAVVANLIPDLLIDGLPVDLIDALWVLANYALQIGLNLAAYLVMNVVMTNIDTHELKLQIKYEE